MSFVTAFQPNAFQNNAFQIDGVVPPTPPTDTGGSGNRRRNINNDPDAFAEFLAEHRAKANPAPEIDPVVIGPNPYEGLLALQEALQAAIEAQEDQLALMALQRRIEEQERAYEAFLEEEDDEILLLM